MIRKKTTLRKKGFACHYVLHLYVVLEQAGYITADTNDKKETSSDKKDNAADKNTENKTVAAGSGAVKNIKKKNIKSAKEKLNDAKAEIKSDKNNNDVYVKKTAAKTDDKKKSTDTKQHDGNIKKNRNR